MPRADSPDHLRLENVIVKLMDEENRLQGEIEMLEKMLVDIKELIGKLPDFDLQTILERKYIHRETFVKIAENMYLSPRTVQRKHAEAIEELERICTGCGSQV